MTRIVTSWTGLPPVAHSALADPGLPLEATIDALLARAGALARPVAGLLTEELGRTIPEAEITAFEALAQRYLNPLEPA